MSIQDIVKTTCPRDCYDACGIAVVRKDGKIAKVLGDPDHAVSEGRLCGKCAIAYNGVWRDEKARLSRPLRRIGAKGDGLFEPISWDEALKLIAERFKDIIAEAGDGRPIVQTHYTGTVGLIGGWFPSRFFNRLGATEVDPDTVCNKAGHAALELTFGDSLHAFDPRTIRDSKTLLIWGANPSHSAPHQDRVFVKKARAAGTKVIVVDPIGHGTAAAADLHLKLAPGTDALLAFAFLHVMQEHGLVDSDFLERHVHGADALLPGIAQSTPARAAALTGVPEETIVEAALAYGNGPSLLWLGQGVQRQPSGGNVFRALSALVAFSGNLSKPGAGFLYMNGAGGRGVDMSTVICPELAVGGTGMVSHMDFAQVLADPARSRALVNWNNNPAASSPQQAQLRKALKREDLFHVAVDLFHTDTTAYADVVLPAASFLECDDLVLSYFDLTLSAQVKAGEPLGEALPNSEIFRRLAAAMGFTEPALFESDDALIERLLEQTAFKGGFADLAKKGTVTLFAEPRLQFEGGSFATPSGRIELSSSRAADLGLSAFPTPHADAPPAPGRIRILSPASMWQMNSSYGNDETIKKRLGPPAVQLHPDDAARNGLVAGDTVKLSNASGQLELVVEISAMTQPGVGVVYKGRWPSSAPDDANVNILVSDRKSDFGESTTVHAAEVDILRMGTCR
ncbi:molybdopterin-dependent oxidoreductase [Tardiphaga sp.]|uniref:molybdopterin-containing oxidoreductase family protein n=1 Tax=Tardiphaga sp. TaxID=1926292 RepID=UPI00260A879A|nr:molybdopterin-dependent oxidoreductase [Tardiphaga sp.]MDB5620385.1 anaerobic dehydrogenase, typically selenocysteine-containing [Tardiphaga sp.]